MTVLGFFIDIEPYSAWFEDLPELIANLPSKVQHGSQNPEEACFPQGPGPESNSNLLG